MLFTTSPCPHSYPSFMRFLPSHAPLICDTSHFPHQCCPAGEVVDKSAGLCAQLLGQPLPTPLPRNIGEYEAFLESGKVPVSGLLYKSLTNKFPTLSEKLLDMGSDPSFLVMHLSSSIELSLSSTLPPGGLLRSPLSLDLSLTVPCYCREL
jgi:hypothetical protein